MTCTTPSGEKGTPSPIARQRWLPTAAVWLLLLSMVACSGGPEARKAKHLEGGQQYLNEKKFEEASLEFRNAVKIDPNFAEAHYQLGRAYLGMDNREAAFWAFSKSAELQPANWDAQLHFAELLISRRVFDKADPILKQAVAARPSDPWVHSLLGRMHALQGDPTSAIQELQRASELAPQRIEYYSALGAILLATGQRSEAEANFRRAVEANPKSSVARTELAQFYYSQQNYERAEAEARAAIDLEAKALSPRLLLIQVSLATARRPLAETLAAKLKEDFPDDPDAYQALARVYLAVGDRNKAADELKSVASAKPADLLAKLQLGDLLLQTNRLSEGEALSEELLKANPLDPRVLLLSGMAKVTMGRQRDALDVLQRAAERDPNSVKAHYYLGLAQSAVGSATMAKTSFYRALKLDPKADEVLVALARLSMEGGNLDEAESQISSALKSDPNSPAASLVAAETYLAKGNFSQAEVMVEKVLKRDPVSAAAFGLLLKIATAQGKGQVAAARLAQAVQNQPGDARLQLLLASAYLVSKELKKSEATLTQAMQLDPRMAPAYTLLANIRLAQGATAEGKAALQKAIELDPGEATNYLVLEGLYEREGNWAEAKKILEQARKAVPTSPVVANQLAYLLLEHGGDPNYALTLAEEASQKMPNSPNVADTLGWAYFKTGRTYAAIRKLEQCAATATCQYHLAMAHAATGNRDVAKAHLEQALKMPGFAYAAQARDELKKLSSQNR